MQIPGLHIKRRRLPDKDNACIAVLSDFGFKGIAIEKAKSTGILCESCGNREHILIMRRNQNEWKEKAYCCNECYGKYMPIWA
jgi:hypothetical protein